MRIYRRPTDATDESDKLLKNYTFTERDQRIVKTIPQYEGFLSVPQIIDLFFNNNTAGRRHAKKRVELMSQPGEYLKRPSKGQRRELPEAIVWLNKKGEAFCAGEGVGFWQTVKRSGVLKDVHMWVKKPRFIQIRHDLMVNEFHLDIELFCRQSDISIVEWIPSYVFKRTGDIVQYINNKQQQVKRKYEPDSYFVLNYGQHEKRFMLEIDRGAEGKEQAHRVFDEKILVFNEYMNSKRYEERFGQKSGRQLIVTSGGKRLENLINMTAKRFGDKAQFFLFTIFEDVSHDTVITQPIWWQYKDGNYRQVRLLES